MEPRLTRFESRKIYQEGLITGENNILKQIVEQKLNIKLNVALKDIWGIEDEF